MAAVLSFLLLGMVTCVHGCDHQHQAPFRGTPSSRPIISRPATPLVWGDINVLHTTDTHGWLGGHDKDTAPEPNYSGDLGIFSSFVTHMKTEAEKRNVDLLLVDSGDLHDGNGITDGYPSGDVNGHEALKLFSQLPYDVLAIGNHELYKYSVAYDVHKNFAPKWNGRYLTSNVNITLADGNNQSTSIPLGARYAKFKTRLGRSVTALGVLFDFKRNSENTTVQTSADMVQESWFKEAISEEPDIFLLVGHMPVQNYTWPLVFNAIRAVHSHTPILIFGGHDHIRDCVQPDGRSMSLASGRYMETIGWMIYAIQVRNWMPKGVQTTLVLVGGTWTLTLSRTLEYHTGKAGDELHTEQGRNLTASVQKLSRLFNLTYQLGTAPTDYFRERVPLSSPQSLLSLLTTQVLPTALSISNARASIPRMLVTNAGALRFDLYAGPFTRNDQFIVSPFTDGYEYLENVSSRVATRILDELNHSGLPARRKRGLYDDEDDDVGALALINQMDRFATYERWLSEQWERWNLEQRDATNLTLGYVTKDACPGAGDDVLHAPLPYYSTPPFIGSSPGHSDNLDLVFGSFIRDSVLQMINMLNAGTKPNVTEADVKPYSKLLANEILGVFANMKWN